MRVFIARLLDNGGIVAFDPLVNSLVCEDNLALMGRLPDGCCDLIYADPPFGAGRERVSSRIQGAAYRDHWPDGAPGFLEFLSPRLQEMHRLLSEKGSLYVHLDWRSAHYVRAVLDDMFGADNFLNEIIWVYRTGGRSDRWFARKHDTLLLYAKHAGRHTFNVLREGVFRTDGLRTSDDGRPYKSTKNGPLYFHPDGPAMTDVWDVPFLSTVSRERTGWPTQKPEALLRRIVAASSLEGDLVADFFCGSGTTPAVAAAMGRRWLGCDVSPQAIAIAERRLAPYGTPPQTRAAGPQT